MNWITSPVTYQGWVWWEGHDYYWDDDYTLNVAALGSNGSVSGSLFVAEQYNPQVEFDSDETVDHFVDVPWWQSFKSSVDNEDQVLHTANATPSGVPKPSDFFPAGGLVIVIGQLGLDCGHSCGTELHPVWAIFVHTKDDPNDDVWAFFVRNWGDEGFCSTNDHQTADQTFTVWLPRLGASNVVIKYPETVVRTTHTVPVYKIAMAQGGGAALASFNLSPPTEHSMIFGELHLKWKTPVPRRIVAGSPVFQKFLDGKKGAGKDDDSVEAALTERLGRLPTVASAQFRPLKRPSVPQHFSTLPGRVVTLAPASRLGTNRLSAVKRPEDDGRVAQRGVALDRLIELEQK
jgi:hypothetical protein